MCLFIESITARTTHLRGLLSQEPVIPDTTLRVLHGDCDKSMTEILDYIEAEQGEESKGHGGGLTFLVMLSKVRLRPEDGCREISELNSCRLRTKLLGIFRKMNPPCPRVASQFCESIHRYRLLARSCIPHSRNRFCARTEVHHIHVCLQIETAKYGNIRVLLT